MRRFLQFVGTIVFFCAWPAFFIYFKLRHSRTRVVLVHDRKVLVMKQWIGDGKWILPGGGLRKGESAVDGAVRETREETSLRLDPRQLSPVGHGQYRRRGLGFAYTVFAAKVGSNKVRAQNIEISELAWVLPEELDETNSSADTLEALRVARGLAASRPSREGSASRR